MPSWANASNAVTTVTSSPGIDANTITELTTDSGVEIRKVVTEWAKVVTPGVALTSATYQIVKRTTKESQWFPFRYVDAGGVYQTMPSTQLNRLTIRTEMLTGVPAAIGHGYAWVQGGNWTQSYASLELVEIYDTVLQWNLDCTLSKQNSWTDQFYAPLDSTGLAYADGSVREAGSFGNYGYTFRRVAADQIIWTTDGVGHWWGWRWTEGSTPGTESYTSVPAADGAGVAQVSQIASVEIPERGSQTLPQVSEEVVMIEYDVTDACGYQRRREAPGLLPYPESEAELNAVAKRRIRRAFSDTLDIPHNLIPYLRVGDHVSVTNHARNLVKKSAYVVAIKRTMDVLNGAARQVTTVKIPPDWI